MESVMTSLDSFKCCKTLKVGSKTYAYYSLPAAEKNGLKGISRLPFSLKVLLENLLRFEDGKTVTKEDIQAFATWLKNKTSDRDVAFRPARVLMQDFTGVPATRWTRSAAIRRRSTRWCRSISSSIIRSR
jgi:aconitate hydratase